MLTISWQAWEVRSSLVGAGLAAVCVLMNSRDDNKDMVVSSLDSMREGRAPTGGVCVQRLGPGIWGSGTDMLGLAVSHSDPTSDGGHRHVCFGYQQLKLDVWGMVMIGGVSERVMGESTTVCPVESNVLWVDRFTVFPFSIFRILIYVWFSCSNKLWSKSLQKIINN